MHSHGTLVPHDIAILFVPNDNLPPKARYTIGANDHVYADFLPRVQRKVAVTTFLIGQRHPGHFRIQTNICSVFTGFGEEELAKIRVLVGTCGYLCALESSDRRTFTYRYSPPVSLRTSLSHS